MTRSWTAWQAVRGDCDPAHRGQDPQQVLGPFGVARRARRTRGQATMLSRGWIPAASIAVMACRLRSGSSSANRSSPRTAGKRAIFSQSSVQPADQFLGFDAA